MGDDRLDFELHDEVLSVIPMDPFEQLDLARKITSNTESVVRELEDKSSRLERDCHEADSVLKTLKNTNLTKEKDLLTMSTVTKLTCDLAKLETFKLQLIKSLSDESAPQTEPVDIRTCDQSSTGSNGSYPGKVSCDMQFRYRKRSPASETRITVNPSVEASSMFCNRVYFSEPPASETRRFSSYRGKKRRKNSKNEAYRNIFQMESCTRDRCVELEDVEFIFESVLSAHW